MKGSNEKMNQFRYSLKFSFTESDVKPKYADL